VLSCQGAQNIGLSHHKLKYALMRTVWSQCAPVPDRRTDGWTLWQWRDDSLYRTHRALKVQQSPWCTAPMIDTIFSLLCNSGGSNEEQGRGRPPRPLTLGLCHNWLFAVVTSDFTQYGSFRSQRCQIYWSSTNM